MTTTEKERAPVRRIIAGLISSASVLLSAAAPAAATPADPVVFEMVAGPYESSAACEAALANWPPEYYCATPPPLVAWLVPAGWYVTTTRS